MGLSSKTQKSSTDPTAYAKPYISAAGNALQTAYGQSSGLASGISDTLAGQLPGLASRAFGANPGLDSATAYNTDVTSGKYLGAGNPYLQGQIDQTGADVTSRVQAAFSNAGRTGSGANQAALGRGLASAENALRYQDYDSERSRMAQAAALAPSLNAAQYSGLGAYLQAGQAAAGLPLSTASEYAGGLGSLFGRYANQKQTYNGSTLDNIGQAINIGKSVAGFF